MERAIFESKQHCKAMISLTKKQAHFEVELKVTMVYITERPPLVGEVSSNFCSWYSLLAD
jgi:hypothetical protein